MPQPSTPYSEDSEKGILCSMLVDSDVRLECLRLCKPQMFFIPAHRLLFITLNEIESSGTASNGPIDFLELKEELNRKGRLSEYGVTPAEQKQTVAEYFEFVPAAANWKHYFGLITDCYRRREIIRFCRKLEAHAADLQNDAAQSVVDNVESLLVKFWARNANGDKSWREIVTECHDSLSNPYQPGEYITFGLKKLDFATGGIKRTNVCVISAETSGGKTALALHVARTSLLNSQPVAFFSLEMSEEELAERMFAIDGGISMAAIRKRSFNPDSIARINDSFGRIIG